MTYLFLCTSIALSWAAPSLQPSSLHREIEILKYVKTIALRERAFAHEHYVAKRLAFLFEVGSGAGDSSKATDITTIAFADLVPQSPGFLVRPPTGDDYTSTMDSQWYQRRLGEDSHNEYPSTYQRLWQLINHVYDIVPMMFIPATIFLMATICYMMPGNQAAANWQPPRYNPDDRSQSFRAYVTDLMHWLMMTPLAPHQQAVAVVNRLEGTARQMGRTLTPQELFNGGVVNGEHLDPVT